MILAGRREGLGISARCTRRDGEKVQKKRVRGAWHVQARMLPRCLLFEQQQEERSTAASLVRFRRAGCLLGGISPTTENAKQHDSTAKLFLPRLGRRGDSPHPSVIGSDGSRLVRKINDQASVGNRATRYMILADGQDSRGGCVFHACSTATLDGSPSAPMGGAGLRHSGLTWQICFLLSNLVPS
jgi:hypothetical protein